jgi:hypothetical protein
MKKFLIVFVIFDNFITNAAKSIFRTKWLRTGHCLQCGNCCKEIYISLTPAQSRSRLFTNIAIRWITWLFDFILLKVDYDNSSLVFTCKHLTPEGKCHNYFWRPNVCRNYPLVDYFKEPVFLPSCGFRATKRKG